ncbi:MAG: hypothetical protein N4A53_07140 [Pelagimonas sp.]|nr:hypothetical protein [Pelagimonas sp.]
MNQNIDAVLRARIEKSVQRFLSSLDLEYVSSLEDPEMNAFFLASELLDEMRAVVFSLSVKRSSGDEIAACLALRKFGFEGKADEVFLEWLNGIEELGEGDLEFCVDHIANRDDRVTPDLFKAVVEKILKKPR